MRNFLIITLVIVLIALALSNNLQVGSALGVAGVWWRKAMNALQGKTVQ